VSRTLVVALLWAAGTAGAAARAPAQDEPRRVSLEEALALFSQNGLALRIARADAARDAARARQAAGYPNPVGGVTHEALNGDDAGGYNETYVTLTQQIRWPWESAARGKTATAEGETAAHRLAGDSLRLAFEMKRTFVEAASAESLRDGLAEATGLVREALRHATDRVTAGDLSGYALRRLRVERARYESELLAATLAMRAARRRLAGLLVPESDSVIAPAGLPAGDPPDVALDALVGLDAGVPALAAARAALSAAQADQQAVSRGRVPAFTATGGYKTQSDGLDGVFLGFTLPFPLFDRRGAAAAEATAASAAAEAQLALTGRLVENDLRLAFETYQAARDRSRLVGDELLTEPEALLRIARVAYAEGEMSLVELLDAVDAFRAARAALVEVRRDLWVSFFDFERAAGGLPSGLEGGR